MTKINRPNYHSFIFIIMQCVICVIILSVLSCSGNSANTNGSGGSLEFSIEWQGAPTLNSAASLTACLASSIFRAPLDCNAAGVSTITVILYDANNNQIALGGPWSCSAHSGVVSNISAGSNYMAVILGKDSSGSTAYYGEQTGITITDGQTTNAGTITVSAFTAPASVTAAPGAGQNVISWNSVTGATSYNIYWSTSPGVTKTNGMKISNAASPYTHTGLTNGTAYSYIVTAVNSYGESAPSSEVSATPGTPPAAPAGVAALAGDSQVTITWNAVSAATSYDIYWSTSPGVTKSNYTGKISDTTIITDTNYTHLGRTNGVTYYYVVTAKNGAGESSALSEVSATPLHDTTPPVNTTANNFINNGALYSKSDTVLLAISATDDMAIAAYYIGCGAPYAYPSGWISIVPTKNYSATVTSSNSCITPCVFNPGYACTKEFDIWFIDTGGNLSTSATGTIIVDTGPPVNTTLSNNFINNGASSTSSNNVTLSISATDTGGAGVAGYFVSENSSSPTYTEVGWIAISPSTTSYSANVNYTLSSGSGLKTVYVWFKDVAGNVSQAVSDSITYSP